MHSVQRLLIALLWLVHLAAFGTTSHASSTIRSQQAAAEQYSHRAQIYACTDQDGHKTFTDRGCSSQAHSQTQISTLSSFVEFSPLTKAEQITLEELAKATKQTITQRQREQRKAQRTAKQQQTVQHKLCNQAKQGLRKLARERRAGYDLEDYDRLQSREEQLTVQKRANC